MLSLSECHMYVQYSTYQGILKLSIVREYHVFNIKVELFKINSSGNQELVNIFMKNCDDDPTNPNICTLISNTLDHTQIFSLNECEELSYAFSSLDKKEKDAKTLNTLFNANIGQLQVILSLKNLLKVYYFFDSFIKNYFILNSVYNIYMKQIDQYQTKVPQITSPISIKQPEINTISPVSIVNNPISQEINNEIDVIFSLALTPILKSSLAHYIFTYYRFIDPKYCYITKVSDNKIKIVTPKILPIDHLFNDQYFISIIYSCIDNNIFNKEKIDYCIKKLISLFLSDNKKITENSISIMMINYLLLIYFLKYTYDFYTADFKYKLSGYLESNVIQTQIFNHFLQNINVIEPFKDSIEFEISTYNLDIFTDNIDTINKLSEEYRHLIPVSHEKFADLIFTEVSKQPKNFNLTLPRILDLNLLKNIEDVTHEKWYLYSNIDTDIKKPYGYIDFGSNKLEQFSPEYKFFKQYLSNNSSILLISDKDLSTDIKFMFDIISTYVIPKLNAETHNLLYIYDLIVQNVPHPENLEHTVILTVIYKIIIPFLYENYKITKFSDYFMSNCA